MDLLADNPYLGWRLELGEHQGIETPLEAPILSGKLTKYRGV
jgi:hypothetical protein